ncbi:F-actin capping protein, alpha subunit [Clavulina sp. PMI_390]|nr:F-actin capping protein, alpha subunit [Clavulina sp. PMI_390]
MADPRIAAAASFLLQSPPGEINDVLNDVRAIVPDDDALQEGLAHALEEYNVTQFITVPVPEQSHQVIISKAGQVSGEEGRYLDPRSHTTFLLDHIRLETSDPQPHEADEASEASRAALETATLAYIADHYAQGVASVFATPDSPHKFTVQIVANKYNPSNFWSGRWRSEYIVDLENGEVAGKVQIHVHYYENGNVQLSASHTPIINFPPNSSLPPATLASKLLANIEEQETNYQAQLNEAYHDLGEKTFKGLRRALPLTKQKIDWERVTGYKLGAELAASKGGFSEEA